MSALSIVILLSAALAAEPAPEAPATPAVGAPAEPAAPVAAVPPNPELVGEDTLSEAPAEEPQPPTTELEAAEDVKESIDAFQTGQILLGVSLLLGVLYFAVKKFAKKK